MARPKKTKSVCSLPESDRFGPLGRPIETEQEVTMTVEEFETIRLIDREAMSQEECALQMQVSRATVQALYVEARKKLAEALVDGKALRIDGGDFLLCKKRNGGCSTTACRVHI